MIELTNNSAFEQKNVPFVTFLEEVEGVEWVISSERGYRELLIFNYFEQVVATITIPHKINRNLNLNLLPKTIVIGKHNFDVGGEITLIYMVHKHQEGGLSLWEQELMSISFHDVKNSIK